MRWAALVALAGAMAASCGGDDGSSAAATPQATQGEALVASAAERMPDLLALFGRDPGDVLSESDMLKFGAPPDAMSGFLEHVVSEYGSARRYLTSVGVREAAFANLEAVLLSE